MKVEKTEVLTPLIVRYIDGCTWELRRAFTVRSVVAQGRISIAKGFITDFNSIPRVLWNILPPTEYGEAAIPHDILYKTGFYNGKPITRKFADQVHRELVQWKGAPAWKVHAFYYGLRLGGWVARRKYRKGLLNAGTAKDCDVPPF